MYLLTLSTAETPSNFGALLLQKIANRNMSACDVFIQAASQWDQSYQTTFTQIQVNC